jgi:hypothetical protein
VEGLDDIGDTYLELDYTNQHLYYYEEGVLKLDAEFVSGTMSNGNGSPDGVYKVVYKQSPAVLVGETYETSVKYFIVFAYNVGVHDATWRKTFGGEIYQKSGSHGCINVALEVVEKLYDMIEDNTPVVAYYRDEVKLTSESAQISNAHSYVEPVKEESAEVPADGTAEQPADGTAEQPVEQPTDGAAEQPVQQPADGTAEQPVEQPTDGAAEQPAE